MKPADYVTYGWWEKMYLCVITIFVFNRVQYSIFFSMIVSNMSIEYILLQYNTYCSKISERNSFSLNDIPTHNEKQMKYHDKLYKLLLLEN